MEATMSRLRDAAMKIEHSHIATKDELLSALAPLVPRQVTVYEGWHHLRVEENGLEIGLSFDVTARSPQRLHIHYLHRGDQKLEPIDVNFCVHDLYDPDLVMDEFCADGNNAHIAGGGAPDAGLFDDVRHAIMLDVVHHPRLSHDE